MENRIVKEDHSAPTSKEKTNSAGSSTGIESFVQSAWSVAREHPVAVTTTVVAGAALFAVGCRKVVPQMASGLSKELRVETAAVAENSIPAKLSRMVYTKNSQVASIPTMRGSPDSPILDMATAKLNSGIHRWYEQSIKSVVKLRVEKANFGPITGTGFIVKEEGLIATNYHVIKGARAIEVTTPQGIFQGTVIARDKAADTAIVKVIGNTKPFEAVKLGNSVDLTPEADAFAIGHPHGVSNKILSVGKADNLYGEELPVENAIGMRYGTHTLKLPSRQGSSGSPVFNTHGEVSAMIKQANHYTAFATSIEHVKTLLDEVQRARLMPGIIDARTFFVRQENAAQALVTRSKLINASERAQRILGRQSLDAPVIGQRQPIKVFYGGSQKI